MLTHLFAMANLNQKRSHRQRGKRVRNLPVNGSDKTKDRDISNETEKSETQSALTASTRVGRIGCVIPGLRTRMWNSNRSKTAMTYIGINERISADL